jgi:hypothetical protein
MPLPCIFCCSQERVPLEKKLVAGAITQLEAAEALKCSRASVQRHMKNHAPNNLKYAIEVKHVDVDGSLDVARQLMKSHADLRTIFTEALRAGDVRNALKALEVEIKQLTLSAKLVGLYSDAPQVAIMMSPEFVRLKQVIVKSLAEYPDALPAVSARIDEIIEGHGSEQ